MAPSLLIVLPLEGRPQVMMHTCRHDVEEERLLDWLAARSYTELIAWALEVAEQERAA